DGSLKQRTHFDRRIAPDREDAKAMAVPELEMRILARELFPQAIDAKVISVFGGVMKEHNAAARHFRQPALKIAPRTLIAMTAIDIEQVDGAVGELPASVGKIGA